MVKVIVSFCILALLCAVSYGKGNGQTDNLRRFLESRMSAYPPVPDTWPLDLEEAAPVYIGLQDGLAALDKIVTLPGQPEGVDFDHYSGYVTVDPSPKDGKALFYYFAESPQNSSTNPLVLWLNGGPGCSSLVGAMTEQGPFKINSDARTLSRNYYAWNKVANILFLESPAGVGFSYSNSSSVYNTTGDKSTANDAYAFLVNWLERFPQYKGRDFYITGESYAGHYVPQLAYTVLVNNKMTNHTMINLKGIAIGNAWIDDLTTQKGLYDYWWTHAMISDETHEGIFKYCNFVNDTWTSECGNFINKAWDEWGPLDLYNIYAPICLDPPPSTNGFTDSVNNYDPCWDTHLISYLNSSEVQKALHAKPLSWDICRGFYWTDWSETILPIIKYLIANGQRLWIYSGDTDGRVPVTSSRYSINAMEIPIQTAWRPWYLNKEVGGYVEEYKGLVFTTVRGAGHMVPASQPERALAMFSSFLQGTLPPAK